MKRIGVMMDLDKPYKRHVSVYGGIRDYAREHPDWKIVIDDWADYSLPEKQGKPIPYDGIIGRITVLGAERAKRLDVPAVNVWLSSPAQGLPGVFPDYAKSGCLVADHLLGRGFRYLAALVQDTDAASFRQATAMEQFVKEAAGGGWLGSVSLDLPAGPEEWRDAVKTIGRWMDGWKLPLGLLVREPGFARLIVELAHDRGWHVPEQIAIVCSLNDEVQCEHPEPGLTAVEMPDEKCGYDAATMLDRLIDAKQRGESPFADPTTVIVPPVGIVTRHSTEFFAVNDPLVRQAMRYIAANLTRPLDAEAVAKNAKVSRRTLDMRFHEALGVTVAAEICRLRIERVKRELTGGKESVAEIAQRTGFVSTRTLNDQFLKVVGVSPRAYRKQGKVGRAGA